MEAFPKVDTTLLCAEQSEGRVSRALCQLLPIPGNGTAVISLTLMADQKGFLGVDRIG